MEFTYTSSIYVPIEELIEAGNLGQMSSTEEIETVVNDYATGCDDCDYYAFDNIFDDVVKAIKTELNIYD